MVGMKAVAVLSALASLSSLCDGGICELRNVSDIGGSCSVDDDCSGVGTCVEGGCKSDGLTAKEMAYVAHLVAENVSSTTEMITERLKDAAAAIAKASDDLEKYAMQAIEDNKNSTAKVEDNIEAEAKASMDSLKKQEAETTRKAKAALKKQNEDFNKQLDEISKKGSKTMKELEKKSQDILKSISVKIDQFADIENKAAQGGATDYSQYSKAYTGGTQAQDKKSKKSKSSGSTSGGADYMNYSKAYTGGSSGGDSKKGGKSKSSKSGSSNGGSFDFKKYLGGASSDKKSKGSKKGSTGGGAVDYKGFMPKMNNAASSSSSGGGMPFDWEKYIPANATTSKKDPAASNNGSSKKSEKKNSSKSKASSSAKKSDKKKKDSSIGSPCGLTLFKDFGDCKGKNTECRASSYSEFAPGMCVNKDSSSRRLASDDSKDDSEPGMVAALKDAAKKPAGSAGGVCGAWALGKIDFGDCKDGYVCKPSKPTFSYYGGKKFALPSLCSKENNTETVETNTKSVEQVEEVPSDDDSKDVANQVADAANEAALKAAHAAEEMAHKLLASASQIRQAAAELKKQANEKTKTASSDTKSEAMLSSSTPPGARSSYMIYALVLGMVAAGFVMWRRSSKSDYQRI